MQVIHVNFSKDKNMLFALLKKSNEAADMFEAYIDELRNKRYEFEGLLKKTATSSLDAPIIDLPFLEAHIVSLLNCEVTALNIVRDFRNKSLYYQKMMEIK